MKPWEARQRQKGFWGWVYRWFYGDEHRQRIAKELRKRR